MRFAICHEDLAQRGDKDAVWAGEPAIARGAVRTIATLTRTGNSGDLTRLQINAPDDMVFRIGEIEAVVRRPCNAFRTREPRRLCWTSITGIAGLASARHMIDSSGRRIEAVHRVTLAQHQIKLPFAPGCDRAGAVQGSPRNRGAV